MSRSSGAVEFIYSSENSQVTFDPGAASRESGLALDGNSVPIDWDPLPPRLRLLWEGQYRHLSELQFRLFVAKCEARGVDPLSDHLVAERIDSGKLVIMVKIEYLRALAERTGKFAGTLGPQWCGPDGAWRDVWLAGEPPAAARAAVLRSDAAEPQWRVARWISYAPVIRDDSGTESIDPFWRRFDAEQLAKCALALGYRELASAGYDLYIREELLQARVLRRD